MKKSKTKSEGDISEHKPRTVMWMIRFRLKETTPPSDFPAIDKYLAGDVLPAFKKVKGVKSARAYHSFHGEIVIVADLERTATLDYIFEAEELSEVSTILARWLVRSTGAEIMWEVPPVNELVANRRFGAMTFN